ncbi:uncharacterized protein [Onthophagus taurus]|uniref:uncharacterized protein isoform X1 n=1 Tax=Onthophagus taurus TaxID=166361 RepID=UPI000C209572|nr:uncharacterized protein LOC111413239 isoform X2 [Onthophagus taurus]
MKKFYTKFSKQQWRTTVPNLNTSIFKKYSKDDSNKENRMSSASYDLQMAEKNYVVSDEVPTTIDSDTEPDEVFEDARTIIQKSKEDVSKNIKYDSDLYVEVEPPAISLKNNSKYEAEVPSISFSFFENRNYDQVRVHKSELKIELTIPELDEKTSGLSTPTDSHSYVNEVFSTPQSNITPEEYSVPIKISENHLKMLEFAEQNINKEEPQENDGERILNFVPKKLSFEEIENLANNDEIDAYVRKSLEEICPPIKSGSDPNLSHTIQEEEVTEYKVPKSLKRNRLSQSMNDFNPDTIQPITKDIDIEHISCSQVIMENPNENSINMDYCKTRSKLPIKLRRVTLLRKPKSKAVDTWTNIKSKVKNFKESSQLNDNKDKLANNIEEMYKNSKSKCKKVLKQTGMMFKKRDQENIDPNDNSSQMIKNDAFFANLNQHEESPNISEPIPLGSCDKVKFAGSNDTDKNQEFDFNTIRSAFRRSKVILNEGQNGFDDLRRYVKQGGDFCKELATILQERSEAEVQYAKNLSKLSNKLVKACREGVGGLNEAWRAVALEMEARAECHRLLGVAILEDAAKPLKNLTESQHRLRKQSESMVDKAAKNLGDWRAAEAKSKKHSHTCARENEKLQDAMLDNRWVLKWGSAEGLAHYYEKKKKKRLSRSASLIHLAQIHRQNSDKENAKLEGKKRKAEDAVKKADIEYYTLCVRAERARLEWESSVSRGATIFQSLEDERLGSLKTVLLSYLNNNIDLGPKLVEASERLKSPFDNSDPAQDLNTFISLRQSSQQISEQLLPDFYCEHITWAMNKERRKQALVKLAHLIRQDIERERKSKNGLENLSRAIKQTPTFGAEDSNQSVSEKLYHMKSMLTYLEGARYKIQSASAELEGRQKNGHPLASHITITRDKSGLQQSVLKVPQWLKEQWCEPEASPISEKSTKSSNSHKSDGVDGEDPDWTDRGTADGNSNQPDSDFDEFSSQGSSTHEEVTEESPIQPIAQCKALYAYTPNLSDELALHPGDILSVYRQQEDGWWLGECNGSVGIFPATYVETLPAPNTAIKC